VLKPHIFPSVPRMWNRVYDRVRLIRELHAPSTAFLTSPNLTLQVMATIRMGSPISRMLFDRAYAYKKACLERGDPDGGRWGAIYDRLIFSKVRAR